MGLITVALPTASAQSDDNYQPRKNPFGQPELLKQKRLAPRNPANPTAAPPPPVPILKLTATLISVSEPMVIVNDRLLRIGEEIDGMRLGLIDEGRAVFYYRGRAHEITIDNDSGAQTR